MRPRAQAPAHVRYWNNSGHWSDQAAAVFYWEIEVSMVSVQAFSLCRLTMRSWKHSGGTEYLRSALEYFVSNEIITFLRSGEYATALKAVTLIGTTSGMTSFVLGVLAVDSLGMVRSGVATYRREADRRGVPRTPC
jgi:hypothetical protein